MSAVTCPKSPRSRTGIIVLMCGIYQRVRSRQEACTSACSAAQPPQSWPGCPSCRLPVPGRLGLAGLAAGGLAALPTCFPRGEKGWPGGPRPVMCVQRQTWFLQKPLASSQGCSVTSSWSLLVTLSLSRIVFLQSFKYPSSFSFQTLRKKSFPFLFFVNE